MRDRSPLHHSWLIALVALSACTSTPREVDDAAPVSMRHLEMPSDALRHYPGRYRSNAETGFRIERRDGRLFLQEFGGTPHELRYVGDGRYECRERSAPIVFTTETERSSGWVHTSSTLHFILDDGSRQTHRRIPGDEITPREVLISEGYEKALPVYRSLLDTSPDDPHLSEPWLIEAGLQMASAERFEPAIGLLRIATELYPGSARTYESVGRVYQQMDWPHAAAPWYHRALEVDPDHPGALKAVAELQAERTAREQARTTRASAGRIALTIRVLIDGADLLRVRGDTVWLEHISRALPGTRVGDPDHAERQPTRVNGVEWIPEWDGRISDVYVVEEGSWPLDVWHVSFVEVSCRGRVVVVEQASEDNDFTFTLMLDDEQLPGSAWYELELRW